MKVCFLIITVYLVGCETKQDFESQLLNTSKDLLLEVKRGNSTDSIRLELAQLDSTKLEQLNDDTSKLTFWLNIYNAYYQELGKRDSLVDLSIFKEKQILIANQFWSFDDIEHGILRGKEEYGYNAISVKHLDYRIHFALNCGAESCPPIATYDKAKLDNQLEVATNWFVNSTTEIDVENKTIRISEIFDWFAEDFEATIEIPELIASYTGEDVQGFEVEYIPWSWESSLGNFREF